MIHRLKRNERGITLVALIVTIIAVLIMSGIAVNLLLADNGIINKATSAKKDMIISQEKEAIMLETAAQKTRQISTKGQSNITLGVELIDRSLANGNRWKIVSELSSANIYGTGYRYIEEGTNIPGYGNLKNNYIVNWNNGEVIYLEKNNFASLGYGENLAVRDDLLLNIDPINMSNNESLGEGVTIYGMTVGDGYGWNGSELKLDGVDDYIEIFKDVEIDSGITLEFYGRNNDNNINMLCKTLKDPNDSNYAKRFRTKIVQTSNSNKLFQACFSGKECGSTWRLGDATKHWISRKLNNFDLSKESGEYITMVVDLFNDTVSLYLNGQYYDSTECDHTYLINGGLTDKTIPFTIGLETSGSTYAEHFSNMSIYACRLYTKVLTSDEVRANYEKTVAGHQLLIQEYNH